MNIKELGYIVLAASDLNAWRFHAEKVLGAMVSDAPEEGVRVRLDERDCRLLIQPAVKDKLTAIGWVLANEDDFLTALNVCTAKSLSPEVGTVSDCVARRVSAYFALNDPAGLRHEIAWGPVVNFRQPFLSQLGVSSFVTGDQGLGHIVVTCEPDQYLPTTEFLRTVLGFKVANFRRQPLDGQPIDVPITWFHCENTRQHSIGVAAASSPGVDQHGCRHINMEVAQLDDVGQAYDRCERTGTPIVRTLGRHVNDRAISFYLQSPSRFLFEYGCDAPRRDWSRDIVYDEGGAGSVWGHKRVTGQ